MRLLPLKCLSVLGSLLIVSGSALAQPSDSGDRMDQMLNQVDQPGYWQSAPASQGNQGQINRQYQGSAQCLGAPWSGTGQYAGRSSGQFPGGNGQYVGGSNGQFLGGNGQYVGGSSGQFLGGNGQYAGRSNGQFPGGNGQFVDRGSLSGGFGGGGLLRTFFGGGAPQQPVKPPENPFAPRNLLKDFLGGDTSSSSTDPQSLYNARSNLQVANDQAAQAEDAASRASWGHKDTRLNAAAEAQDHANAARGAADRATSAAYGKSMPANDAAAQARDAANRAQAAADRASYNASLASD